MQEYTHLAMIFHSISGNILQATTLKIAKSAGALSGVRLRKDWPTALL